MAELRPYQQSWRDQIGEMIAGDNGPGSMRYVLAHGLLGSAGVGGANSGLADFTPAAAPLWADEAYINAANGDYGAAAMKGLSVAAAAAPAIPKAIAGAKKAKEHIEAAAKTKKPSGREKMSKSEEDGMLSALAAGGYLGAPFDGGLLRSER